MASNVTALPHSARLQLTAVSLAKGQYTVLNQGLFWRLEATYLAEDKKTKAKPLPEIFTSRDAQPLFVVPPGVYRLTLEHDELGDKQVANIRLLAGTLTDEVIYLGEIDIDDSEENFHLNDNDEFDPNREYDRRLADRQSEAKYGDMAAEIRQPNILGEEAGFEQAAEMAAQSGIQSHPLIGDSPQFDGTDAKMNPVTDNNVHAAEAQKDPELRPGAKPQSQPRTSPQFRPGGM
ncbi:MAG: hypothetical protein P1U34_03980 [Coxiellaceae bacterium]|nr:hypothetical protein [Coxiellaceae bacterium]